MKLLTLALAAPALGLQLSERQSFSVQSRHQERAHSQSCSLTQHATSELMFLRQQDSSTFCSASQQTNGVDFMSLIHTEHKPAQQMAVWVLGYPRSGSSTILSMVSATIDNNRDPNRVFSLFEPCHGGDSYDKYAEPTDGEIREECPSLLWNLAQCKFDGVKDLWGWADPHSTNNHTKFTPAGASTVCQQADIVAFKTVDFGHDLPDWKWLLDSHPDMRVLDIVRDPRGIYASWKDLEPFKSLVEAGDFYTLSEVCENFAKNIEFKDKRVHRIIFEDLMQNPGPAAKAVYEFLGQPWTQKQEAWIHGVFENTHCPPPEPGMEGFTDCHNATTASGAVVMEKWHKVLSKEDKAEFLANPHCRRVAEEYGYPLDEDEV